MHAEVWANPPDWRNDMPINTKIKELFREQFGAIATLLLLSLFSSVAFNIVMPNVNGRYFDVLSTLEAESLPATILALLGINLISLLLSFLLSYITSIVTSRLSLMLNFNIIDHIQKIPLNDSVKQNSSYMTQQVNNDSHVAIDFYLGIVTQGFVSLIVLVTTVSLMFNINATIGYLYMLTIPLYVLLYLAFKSPLYKKALMMKNAQSHLFAEMNRQMGNIAVIKQQSWFSAFKKDLVQQNQFFMKQLARHSVFVNFSSSSSVMIIQLFNVVVLFLGGVAVVRGRMTIGEVIIITAYINSAVGSTRYFIETLNQYQSIKASLSRLDRHLLIPQETNNSVRLNRITEVSLEQVTFDINGRNILNDFSYSFTCGAMVALTGVNGRGKSTFVHLLTGIVQNYAGTIRYNACNLSDLDMYDMRKYRIGIVEQNPVLISNNLKTNLTYGLEEVDELQLASLMEAFQLNPLAMKEGSGDELVLSGGEKQKVSIIRTLLKKPDLLILDEPTSMLDQEAVRCLHDLLLSYKQSAIVLVITHNPSLIAICDRVIDMDESRVLVGST